LVGALIALGVAPSTGLGQTTPPATTPTTLPASPAPSGLVPAKRAAPTPARASAPASTVTRRPAAVYSQTGGGSTAPTLPLSFVRPSPPALVVPQPAGQPAPAPAPTLPPVLRPGAASASRFDLTALVWASFFAAAVIAVSLGIIHRIRTRPSGVSVFGRPTNEVDEWLASAELAATSAPAPVEPDAETPPEATDDADAGRSAADPAEHA
jgi:hypothetical protein